MHATKNAISAALMLGFVGAAQAQVSIYGLIDMSIGRNEFVGEENVTLHSGGDDGSTQGNSTTRIGVKGSTDVGSGLKANFRFETGGIDSAGGVNGNGNFFNRQAWLGFSGGFGELRAGRQDSVPFQVMGQFDFNGQSNGVTSAYSGVGVWATGRQARSLQYISPNMSGLKLHAGLAPEDGYDTAGSGTPGSSANDKTSLSVAATYTAGPLAVGGAFESKRVTGGDDFASIAASYDFKAFKLMAGYMDGPTVFSQAFNNNDARGPVVGIVVPVAGFNVGAHYAKDTKNSKDGVLELFANKEVFKNTYGYAEMGYMTSNTTPRDGDVSAAVGIIYVF